MDVNSAMRAIDGMHLGATMVTFSPVGTGSSGGWRIAISTHWEVLDGSSSLSEVITEREWNGHSASELPAFVLGGLYAHDFAIGSAYQQRFIPT
jgi:hypothetical protein